MRTGRSNIVDIGMLLGVAAGGFALERLAGVPALFAGLVPICTMTLAAVTMVRLRGEPWGLLGLRRPTRLWTLPFWFVGLLAAFYLLNVAALVLVQSGMLAPPDLSKFGPVHGNLKLLAFGLISIWVTAAFFEELVFRGFLLDRLQKIMGTGVVGIATGVIVQAIVFGALHFYQGVSGMLFAGAAGVLFAAFYLLQGRNIWAQVMVHGLVDTVGLVNFYLAGVRI